GPSRAGGDNLDCHPEFAPRTTQQMASELVSVVIPCFNVGRYVEGAVDSGLKQRKPGVEVEIIVVDDASTDDTAAQVESAIIAHPGLVHLVRQPANFGPGVARNTGLSRANGAFACFLDVDDRYEPGFFSWSLAQFSQRPLRAAIITDIELEDC